jgi:hypothetical protein
MLEQPRLQTGEPRFVPHPCVFPGPESFARHRAGAAGCVLAASFPSLFPDRHHPDR